MSASKSHSVARQRTRTAAGLLEELRDYGPHADGDGLAFERDPPEGHGDALRLLQTGVRALLTGRRWFGIDARGRGCGQGPDGALDPGLPLPPAVTLLTVEGDGSWDRVRPSAREACRECFSRQ